MECERAQQDKKFAYSKAIVIAGLHFIGYHSSIIAGDGRRANIYHKLQFPQLFRNSNTIYIRISRNQHYHVVLGLINGAGDPNIIHEILYNFVVNLTGEPGKNIEVDYANELINAVFEAIRKRMKGNQTDKSIERASQSMQFVNEIEAAFGNAVLDEDIPHHKSKEYIKYKTDFNAAIKIILMTSDKEEVLLTEYGARHHAGFIDFCYNLPMVQDVAKMKSDITALSVREDAYLE